jgi:hypothetical protein
VLGQDGERERRSGVARRALGQLGGRACDMLGRTPHAPD